MPNLMWPVTTMSKRQAGEGGLDGTQTYDDDPYYSPEWVAARYAILGIILVAILMFFCIGYYHAQRRLRQGLPPLAYHSFMVRRQYQPQPYYGHGAPQYAPGQEYPMQDGMPPPPYQPPPVYQPPVGATKVLPNQDVAPAATEAGASRENGAGAASDRPRFT